MTGTQAQYDWYSKWTKEDLEAQWMFMRAFSKELKDAGVYVATEGLASPEHAKVVRAGDDGEPITDGVFPGVQGIPRGLLDH